MRSSESSHCTLNLFILCSGWTGCRCGVHNAPHCHLRLAAAPERCAGRDPHMRQKVRVQMRAGLGALASLVYPTRCALSRVRKKIAGWARKTINCFLQIGRGCRERRLGIWSFHPPRRKQSARRLICTPRFGSSSFFTLTRHSDHVRALVSRCRETQLFHQLAISVSTYCRDPDASPPSKSCWTTAQPARTPLPASCTTPTVDKSALRV